MSEMLHKDRRMEKGKKRGWQDLLRRMSAKWVSARRMTAVCMAAALMIGSLAGCGAGDKGSIVTGEEEKSGSDIAGSTGENSASGTKGRFLESEVTLPEGAERIFAMGKLADGSIEVLARNSGTGYLFRSEDMGESWTTVELAELGDCYVDTAAIAPDGTAVMAGYFMEVDGMEKQVLRQVALDGTMTVIPCQLPEIENELASSNFMIQVGYDASGNLFAMDLNHEILRIDTATGAVEEACENGDASVSYFGLAGEKLLLVEEAGILVCRTTDGSMLSQDTVLNDLIKTDGTLLQKASNTFPLVFAEGVEPGSIVYACSAGIFYHGEGGSISEQLVNSELSSLGGIGDYYSIAMMDEEHFLLQVADSSGNSSILKYSYDKDVPAVPEKELDVYALEDSTLLRQAVALYQKENQNVYVKLEIGISGADGMSAEDAISALNTEIMAGNAPDVLILDGLPVDSYMEKGILADISDVVEEIAGTDGIFENIRETYEKDGKCYQMPMRFYPILVDGPKEAVTAGATLADFADYVEKLTRENPGKEILQERSAKELLWTLYQADSANWLTEDGELDEEQLENWLIQAKRLYEVDGYGDDAPERHIFQNWLNSTVIHGSNGILLKSNLVGFGTITNILSLAELLAIDEETGGTFGMFGGQDSFVPYLMAGRSSGSDVPDEAKAFLSLLLGKDMNSVDENGFPVNRAAWDAVCERGMEQYGESGQISMGMASETGEYAGYQCNDLSKEKVDAFTALLEGLDTPVLTDATIQSLVLEQGELYLKGDCSLEDTMSALCQKINLYLAES